MNALDFLSHDNTLLVSKPLAKAIGIGQAIMLCRIHFWIDYNKKAASHSRKADRHFRDGRWWMYNSYPKWAAEIEIYSEESIKRFLTELEELGLILSSEDYNQLSFDKTKWYTIDYPVYEQFVRTWEECGSPIVNGGRISPARRAFLDKWAEVRTNLPSDQIDLIEEGRLTWREGQVDPADEGNLTSPIPIKPEKTHLTAHMGSEGSFAGNNSENSYLSEAKEGDDRWEGVDISQHAFVKAFLEVTKNPYLKSKDWVKAFTEDISATGEEGAKKQIFPCLLVMWDTVPGFETFAHSRMNELIHIKDITPLKILQNLRKLDFAPPEGSKKLPGFLLWRKKNPSLCRPPEEQNIPTVIVGEALTEVLTPYFGQSNSDYTLPPEDPPEATSTPAFGLA